MLSAFPNAMPLEGLVGGLLIGLAAAVALLGAGRIAGVSGLAARATGLGGVRPEGGAALFLGGLLLGAFLIAEIQGEIVQNYPPSDLLIVAAGLIVGFGTRLGSGCTSGHGVCGMSRLSPRSIIATLIFIAAGVATVAVTNMLGWGW